jgi:hypothetical protein
VARIFTTVEGTWPIARLVARDLSTMEVCLLDMDPHEKSGQEIVLRRSGKSWTLEQLLARIAD